MEEGFSMSLARGGLQEARDVAYKNIEMLHFEGMRFRSDIGKE